MSNRKTSRRRKAGQRNAQRGASHVGSGDVVVCGPETSEARILDLTNDLAEGYKGQTKKELRDVALYWSRKHAESVASEYHLAHEILLFALQKIKAVKRGATDNT